MKMTHWVKVIAKWILSESRNTFPGNESSLCTKEMKVVAKKNKLKKTQKMQR